MKSTFAFLASAAAAAVSLIALLPGCSSENVVEPPATPGACDSTRCLAGNTCLAYEGETKCRKTCSSNDDPATSCPFGYTCLGAGQSFCVKDNTTLTKAAGQWGAPCNAAAGSEGPDCDVAQGFFCQADLPSDGAAYCTRYGCTSDRDCGAGFGCQDVNLGPSADSTKRTISEVFSVCVPRKHCSACETDVDCPAVGGVPSHCVAGEDNKSFCVSECADDSNCPFDAMCADLDGTSVCYPRAGTCAGDGALCSPCRSDVDCGADGICLQGAYTTEKTCAKKTGFMCKDLTDGTTFEDFGCGEKPAEAPGLTVECVGGDPYFVREGEQTKVRYRTGEFYCVGTHAMGEGRDLGCYSKR